MLSAKCIITQRIWTQSFTLFSTTAFFSTKRSIRNTKNSAAISSAGQKQRQQLNRLRAALVTKELQQMPLPRTSISSPNILQTPRTMDDCKRKREFARMLRQKEARDARVKHLPLFREGSALFRHLGMKTLGDYADLPTTNFDGTIAVIHSETEEQEYVKYLREQKIVGVDTEARPDFLPLKRKKSNPVCLIQVSTLEKAFLYRLQRGKPLPPVLRELFADPDVLKVGHSLSDDVRHLRASGLIQAVSSTVDTLYIAHKLGCKRPGLKTACQVFLGGSLDKEMQVSDWEAPILSEAQITYAATDAWAPMRILLAMIQLKETKDLLRTKSFNVSTQTIINEDHEVLLGKLLSFALRHQAHNIEMYSLLSNM